MKKLLPKKASRFFSMFCEPDGKASFSRISSMIVLASWIAWVSFIVFNTKSLPSGMWEISTVVGVLYSLNKVTTAIADAQSGSSSSSTSSTVTETSKSS